METITINLEELTFEERVLLYKSLLHKEPTCAVTMPKIVVAKTGDKIDISNCIDESLKVYVYSEDNGVGRRLSSEELTIVSNTLILPTINKEKQYVIKYEKRVEEAIAPKFPNTVSLEFMCLKNILEDEIYLFEYDAFK